MHSLVHHHAKKRKELEESTFSKQILYRITVIAGILAPLMVLPQIFKIFSTHDASGVSAISWFAFALLDAPFIIYGFVHKEKPIVITYTLFFIGNLIVGIGALIYS